MAFISTGDEFISIDVILFPRLYKEYNNINNRDILYRNAKV